MAAEVAGEAPGVDAGDAGDAVAAEELVEALLGAPVGRPAGHLTHDDAGAVDAAALVVVRVHAVVPDVGIGEGDDLPGVGRVGEDLLVARQRGVEHELAGGDPEGLQHPDRLALEVGPVRQDQQGRPLRTPRTTVSGERQRWASPSMTTGSPARSVWRTRPVSFRPAKGVLRDRLARRVGSTSHTASGSKTHRWAGRPGAIGPPWSARPARRAGCQDRQGQRPGQVEEAGADQLGERQGQGRLEAEHPGRRLVEGPLLLLGRVGGVVGGDGVDGAVGQALLDGLHVAVGPQRRVDLEQRVVAAAQRVGEGEVVGGGFGGDGQPLGLGRPDQLDRGGGRQVEEVDPSAGEAGQGDVAGHDHRLGLGRHAGDAEPARPGALVHVAAPGQRRVLAVLGQHGAGEGPGVLQGPAHEAGVGHTGAVVGEDPHPEAVELAEGGQLLAGPALGDAGRGDHVAGGVAPEPQHLLHHRGGVDRRVGVGHGHQRGVPAEGAGPGAGLDGLGVLPAGFPEVGVEVDEAGGDDAPVRSENSGARRTDEAFRHFLR